MDCPSHRSCSPGGPGANQCLDPCSNPEVARDLNCGPGAECVVRGHSPRCQCPIYSTGDPYYRGCQMSELDRIRIFNVLFFRIIAKIKIVLVLDVPL